MTPEQREELKALATEAAAAEIRLHWSGYWNVPREADKAAEVHARVAELRAEARIARDKLEAAIEALGQKREAWVRVLAVELTDAARKLASAA